MIKRKLSSNTCGVVGIVATVLLIGLIIAFVGIIKTVHVPNWIEQKEAQHMNEVEQQLIQLKYTLDVLSLLQQTTAITNYITLGSDEIPFFNEGRTYDTLEILSNICQIQCSNISDSLRFPFSTLVFSSGNTYYVNQEYAFEAGALILNQYPNNILLGQPLFSIRNFTNVSLTLINISGLEGKAFISGYGTYALCNEYLSVQEYRIHNLTNINITSPYLEAWRDFFNISQFVYSGLTYTITLSDDALYIAFSDTLGNLDLKIINIRSQLAIWEH